MEDDPRYFPRLLRPAEIDQAYPLLRELSQELTIDDWRNYARELVDRSSGLRRDAGIIVIEAERRYLRGFFVYRAVPSFHHRRTLVIEHVAVPSSFDRRRVATCVIRTAQYLALRHRCRAIYTALEPANRWLGELLRESGYKEKMNEVFQLIGLDAIAQPKAVQPGDGAGCGAARQ